MFLLKVLPRLFFKVFAKIRVKWPYVSLKIFLMSIKVSCEVIDRSLNICK